MSDATFEFTLRFDLPSATPDPKSWTDALYEAGCDDAVIGVAKQGQIGLAFSRKARNASQAIKSAIADVKRAIRGAELVSAEPDVVGLAEIARLAGCSRQNLRKYAAGEARRIKATFPAPTFSAADGLWRLAEIGPWLARHTSLQLPKEVLQIGQQTSLINLKMQALRLKRAAKSDIGRSLRN